MEVSPLATETISQDTHSPFELQAQKLQDGFAASREVRLRQEKVYKDHLTALNEQLEESTRATWTAWEAQEKSAIKTTNHKHDAIKHRIDAYKKSAEKRKPKLIQGINSFEGDQTDPWQLYDHRRIKPEKLSLKNICGPWTVDPEIPAQYRDSQAIHWLPRKEEILRIKKFAETAREGVGLPGIVEIGCGTGLLSYLLANEGELSVVGMDPDEDVLLGSESSGYSHTENIPPYTHPNLKLILGTSKTMLKAFKDTPPDVVISSWIPEKINLMPDIVALRPKVIVLMYDDKDKRFGSPPDGYKRVFYWHGPSCGDVWTFGSHVYGGLNKVDIRNDNVIDVLLRDDQQVPNLPKHMEISQERKYSWEDANLEKLIEPYTWERFNKDPNYSSRIPTLKEDLKMLLEVEPLRPINP